MNLALLAEESLERNGDYEALVFEGRSYRSGELHERSRRLAGGLREAGVETGDRVVVLMANCPEVTVSYNAIWRAGATVTPAIFLLPPPELRHVLQDSGARVVLTSPEFVDTVEAAGAGLDLQLFSTDDFAALEQAAPGAIEPGGLAALMYTGGTTGRAKGVALTHESLWWAGKAAVEAGHVPGVVRGLGALPLSHAFGLLVTVNGMHVPEPSLSVLMRWFEATRWLELATEHRVQIAAVVPSMLQLLLLQPLEDYDLSELRYLACGAAPLAPETIDELGRRLPHAEVREGYGLTETSALVSTNPPGRPRRGSVGLPVPGCEVRILDEDDRDVAPGEVGEICVRSPGVMAGYWQAPELTGEALRGGWLHTGDMGRVDADGYLYVVDRKKDLIIRGGFNVFPRDVEEALLEHPAVAAAAVVGRPDPVHGEEVVAFVSLRGEATEAELVEHGRLRLGGYKYPREVHVVDSLPLTPVGKVDRKAVRSLVHEVRGGMS